LCSRCGLPLVWAGASGREAPDAQHDEGVLRRRVRILKKVLQPHGIKVETSVLASAIRLTSPNGETFAASGTQDLWPLVERLIGAPLDPLAPCYTTAAASLG